MKGILEYLLPEEADEYAAAQNGSRYLAIIQEYDNYLRGRLKHEELPDDVRAALQAARDRLHEELDAYALSAW